MHKRASKNILCTNWVHAFYVPLECTDICSTWVHHFNVPLEFTILMYRLSTPMATWVHGYTYHLSAPLFYVPLECTDICNPWVHRFNVPLDCTVLMHHSSATFWCTAWVHRFCVYHLSAQLNVPLECTVLYPKTSNKRQRKHTWLQWGSTTCLRFGPTYLIDWPSISQ